ncbi:MAG: hypothetical protein KKE53_13150 [Proteobacteria bacterium]|nr:hypothetical protein [Pseudomonadota bacterium]
MPRLLQTITSSFFFLLLLAGTATAAEAQLQIAVAAEGTEMTSQISQIAARAPYFLIFDQENKLLQTVENPSTDVRGGAGPRAAALLAEKKVTLVIAGEFGRKMEAALNASQIQTIERQGRVIDAVKEQNHAQK